jgi:dolichyl-phosphate beta-glucosyltransferase
MLTEITFGLLFGGLGTLLTFLYKLYPTFREPLALEQQFKNTDDELQEFPHYVLRPCKQNQIIDLSIIIPAFNEIDRLPLMLEETLEYLRVLFKKNSNYKVEIIIVDDASKDQTSKVGHEFQKRLKTLSGLEIRVMTLLINRGKGGAVAQVQLRLM